MRRFSANLAGQHKTRQSGEITALTSSAAFPDGNTSRGVVATNANSLLWPSRPTTSPSSPPARDRDCSPAKSRSRIGGVFAGISFSGKPYGSTSRDETSGGTDCTVSSDSSWQGPPATSVRFLKQETGAWTAARRGIFERVFFGAERLGNYDCTTWRTTNCGNLRKRKMRLSALQFQGK